jgi:hypothetical protein
VINYWEICPNSLSARFILAIQNLNSKIGNVGIQPSDIQNLIETFGTSVITHVTYGGRATLFRKGVFTDTNNENLYRSNEDDVIFQGGDTIAIQTTSEKYNTWKRTLQENPNIIAVKYISLGKLFDDYRIFSQFGIINANLDTIQAAFDSYMGNFRDSILDTS